MRLKKFGLALVAAALIGGIVPVAQSTVLRITRYAELRSVPTISSGTLTINLANGPHFTVTLNANVTTLTISNPFPSTSYVQTFTVAFVADGTVRTITWPGSVKFPGGSAPTMTGTNGKVDMISFISFDAGSSWLAIVVGQNW